MTPTTSYGSLDDDIRTTQDIKTVARFVLATTGAGQKDTMATKHWHLVRIDARGVSERGSAISVKGDAEQLATWVRLKSKHPVFVELCLGACTPLDDIANALPAPLGPCCEECGDLIDTTEGIAMHGDQSWHVDCANRPFGGEPG